MSEAAECKTDRQFAATQRKSSADSPKPGSAMSPSSTTGRAKARPSSFSQRAMTDSIRCVADSQRVGRTSTASGTSASVKSRSRYRPNRPVPPVNSM